MKILPLPDNRFLVSSDEHGEQEAHNHYHALQLRDAILEERNPPVIPDPEDWAIDEGH